MDVSNRRKLKVAWLIKQWKEFKYYFIQHFESFCQGVTLYLKWRCHKLSIRFRSHYFAAIIKQKFRNCFKKVFAMHSKLASRPCRKLNKTAFAWLYLVGCGNPFHFSLDQPFFPVALIHKVTTRKINSPSIARRTNGRKNVKKWWNVTVMTGRSVLSKNETLEFKFFGL